MQTYKKNKPNSCLKVPVKGENRNTMSKQQMVASLRDETDIVCTLVHLQDIVYTLNLHG